MVENATAYAELCGNSSVSSVSITLLFVVSPIHFLILKVLGINLRFDMPRHIILFCLSASDFLQIIVTAVCMTILKVANLSIGSSGCTGVRIVMQFNAAATIVVSSFTLVALSIERYIVCFYCYRFHEILTNKRAVIVQIFILVCGIAAAVPVAVMYQPRTKGVFLSGDKGYFISLLIIVTCAVSVALIFTQSRLLWLSWQKLHNTGPETPSDGNSTAEIGRRRQFKITFVASIVVLAYLISMAPISCILAAYWFNQDLQPSKMLQSVAVSLGLANTLANPLIYGFGMVDIRQAVRRELKRIFRSVTSKLGISQNQ